MEQRRISVAKLKSNSGQIEGVPANPREWTKEDVSKLEGLKAIGKGLFGGGFILSTEAAERAERAEAAELSERELAIVAALDIRHKLWQLTKI